MPESIFLPILNMSITAAIAAVAIIIIRAVFAKKLPKVFSYTLWAIVLLRLIIPFSFSSMFSIFNVVSSPSVTMTNPVQQNTASVHSEGYVPKPYIAQEDKTVGDTVNGTTHSPVMKAPPTRTAERLLFAFSVIWIIGVMGILLFGLAAYRISLSRLKTAVIYKDNGIISECLIRLKLKRDIRIFVSDRINTPLVCGFIRPRIILPIKTAQDCSDTALRFIITHELVHIKRFDNIIKPLALIALSLHWFNPVIWLSFILSQKDMEMSCDEKVLLLSGSDRKSHYANSLINLAARQNTLLNGGILAFGESGIKSRVKGIMQYKRPGFLALAASVILILGIGCLLLTNNVKSNELIKSANPTANTSNKTVNTRTKSVKDDPANLKLSVPTEVPTDLTQESSIRDYPESYPKLSITYMDNNIDWIRGDANFVDNPVTILGNTNFGADQKLANDFLKETTVTMGSTISFKADDVKTLGKPKYKVSLLEENSTFKPYPVNKGGIKAPDKSGDYLFNLLISWGKEDNTISYWFKLRVTDNIPTNNPTDLVYRYKDNLSRIELINLNSPNNKKVFLDLPEEWHAKQASYKVIETFSFIDPKNQPIRELYDYEIFNEKNQHIGIIEFQAYYKDQPDGGIMPNHSYTEGKEQLKKTKLGDGFIYFLERDLPREERTEKYTTYEDVFVVIPIKNEMMSYNFSLEVPLGEDADKYIKIIKDMLS